MLVGLYQYDSCARASYFQVRATMDMFGTMLALPGEPMSS